MQAISAIDAALWDLKGKYYNEPVYRLIGGPTRDSLPAYVSTLGYSVDPERVRERAEKYKDAGFVAQPDTMWAGGISETDKICSLGSVHDVPVTPHGYSIPVNLQVSAAQSPMTTPMVEYLVKWNEGLQFFFEEPVKPEDGVFELPTEPGLGVSVDELKIEESVELSG